MRITAPSVPIGAVESKDSGMKYGQRRVEPVAAAGEVVAHLVRAENGQDRRAVPEAVQERVDRQVELRAAEVRQERKIAVLADERRGDQRDEEQRDVLPPDVLEALARFGRVPEGGSTDGNPDRTMSD